MPLSDLTDRERTIIGKCLRVVADGSFFEESEFESFLSLTPSEMRCVADEYPHPDEFDDAPTGHNDQEMAINNTLLNLTYLPHAEWCTSVGVSREELQQIFLKWKGRLHETKS